MSEPHPEWLVLLITLIALALAPVASKLVRDVGNKVSDEVGGTRKDDETADRAARDDEISQMLAARAYLRERRTGEAEPEPETAPPADADDDLRDEVRQVVIAGNERRTRMGETPLDVEAETERRLARLLGHGN